MRLAQGVNQFNDRIGSHARSRTGSDVLKFAKRTGLVIFIGGLISQKTFWFFAAVATGKGNFFLFGKFQRQLTVDPVFHIEESVIEHFLGGLRVAVDFPHKGFNQPQF
ncbi:hypothetical protein BvCmsKSNP073_00223 [Escherichia coli]|nr:hypothetical protein BvCmsKSNP073_00223 [Escherichia coli]